MVKQVLQDPLDHRVLLVLLDNQVRMELPVPLDPLDHQALWDHLECQVLLVNLEEEVLLDLLVYQTYIEVQRIGYPKGIEYKGFPFIWNPQLTLYKHLEK